MKKVRGYLGLAIVIFFLSLGGKMCSSVRADQLDCNAISCMPEPDQDALKRAIDVAKNNRKLLFGGGMCLGASIDLAEALQQEALSSGSKLSGWTIQIITGCDDLGGRGSHNGVRLKSSMTGNNYFLDSHNFINLCKLTEINDNEGGKVRWISSGCLRNCTYWPDPIPWLQLSEEERQSLLKGITCRIPQDHRPFPLRGVQSFDPNDKVGGGEGKQRYTSGQEPLKYLIRFENLETASAPAEEVIIIDEIDKETFDLETVGLGPIIIGSRIVVPPLGVHEFNTNVDFRPDKNLIVKVTVNLDKSKGVLTWRIISIDPATGLRPADPLMGFLPPNTHPPVGEGSVLLTIRPRSDLATGTEIRNKAKIVFDTNDPIETPEWLNTIDNTSPASRVSALPSIHTSPSFLVNWSGADEGAGIKDYSIFVSAEGGPFTEWLRTKESSGIFTGEVGKSYAFYSVARDHTGNLEGAKPAPDATTLVVANSGKPSGGGGGCDINTNGEFDFTLPILLLLFYICRRSKNIKRST